MESVLSFFDDLINKNEEEIEVKDKEKYNSIEEYENSNEIFNLFKKDCSNNENNKFVENKHDVRNFVNSIIDLELIKIDKKLDYLENFEKNIANEINFLQIEQNFLFNEQILIASQKNQINEKNNIFF